MLPEPLSTGPSSGSPAYPVIRRVVGWTLVCWVIIFWRLSYLPLLDPDEAHYAQITHEMVQAGQWLIPTINGAPIIDKPVLFHWLQGLSFSVLGESELAARLPSALSALVLLWLTFWCGRRLFGAEVGQRGALMLALTPLTFELSSIAIFDMLFTTFLFGAFALCIVSGLEKRWRLQIPAAISLSLAIQTKGPVAGLLFCLAIGLAMLFPSCREALRRVRWVRVALAAGILALPWFLWMWIHFGKQFVDDYLLYNNLQLFASPLYRQRFYPFFYFRVFAAAFFPWSLLLAGRLIDLSWAKQWRRLPAGEVLLWVWTSVIFCFFTASRFKLDTYIYPLAPAACLLASRAWQHAMVREDRSPRATRVGLLLAGVLLSGAGVVAVIASLYVDLRLPPWGLAVPAAAILGGAYWTVRLIRRRLVPQPLGLPFLASLLVVYVGVVLVGLPAYRQARPAPQLGMDVARLAGRDDVVAIYRQERWKASVRFYSRHPVAQVETPEALAPIWHGATRVYCVMVGRDVKALRALGWNVYIISEQPGVVGTAGSIIRQQVWGQVVVASNRPVDFKIASREWPSRGGAIGRER